SVQSWVTQGRSKGEHQWENLIAQRLNDAPLDIAGLLAETTITIADLRTLEIGDLIMTEKPATQPVVLTAEGVPKFLAHIGQFKGKRAMKIHRAIRPNDRV